MTNCECTAVIAEILPTTVTALDSCPIWSVAKPRAVDTHWSSERARLANLPSYATAHPTRLEDHVTLGTHKPTGRTLALPRFLPQQAIGTEQFIAVLAVQCMVMAFAGEGIAS